MIGKPGNRLSARREAPARNSISTYIAAREPLIGQGGAAMVRAAAKAGVVFSRVAHDPEKWEPVSRLREARFGGRRKVGQDHSQELLSEAMTAGDIGGKLRR